MVYILFVFASCKKNYLCTCTTATNGQTSTVAANGQLVTVTSSNQSNQSVSYIYNTKSNAENQCSARALKGSQGTTTSCVISLQE